MAKSFNELKKGAEDIRTNYIAQSNTADVVGRQMLDMVEKQESEQTERLKLTTDYNVSSNFPTAGIEGTSRYTFETAVSKLPAALHRSGIKMTYLQKNNTWVTYLFNGNASEIADASKWVVMSATVLQELGDSKSNTISQDGIRKALLKPNTDINISVVTNQNYENIDDAYAALDKWYLENYGKHFYAQVGFRLGFENTAEEVFTYEHDGEMFIKDNLYSDYDKEEVGKINKKANLAQLNELNISTITGQKYSNISFALTDLDNFYKGLNLGPEDEISPSKGFKLMFDGVDDTIYTFQYNGIGWDSLNLSQELGNSKINGISQDAVSQEFDNLKDKYTTKTEFVNEMVGVVKDYKGVSFPLVTGDVNAVPILNLPKVKTPFSFCFNFVGVKTGKDTDNFFREHNGGIGNFLIRASINTLGVGLFDTWIKSNIPYNYGNTSVVVSHDGDNTAKCWVNGVEYSKQIPFIEGGSVIKMYDATITSEIRTFNYAFTQSDVDMLYNQGRWSGVNLGSEWRVGDTHYKELNSSCEVTNYGNGTVTFDNDITTILGQNGLQNCYFRYNMRMTKGQLYRQTLEVLESTGRWSLYDVNTCVIEPRIPNDNIGTFINCSVKQADSSRGQFLMRSSSPATENIMIKFRLKIEAVNIIGEFLSENLSPTVWKNTGANNTPIALTDPEFTFDAPFKEKTFGSGAPTAIPEAAFIEYSDTLTGNIYKVAAKPNTRQFDITDWKRINN